MRDKRILEILKKQILNNNAVEKSFEDIRNIDTCDNYEELLHILRCIENIGKMTPEINKENPTFKLEEDYKITTVKVKTSPEDVAKVKKVQQLLKEADINQEQNGGRVKGVEFPFDEKATSPRWTPHSDNNILGVVKEVRTNLIPPREVRLPFDTPIQEEKAIAFGSKAGEIDIMPNGMARGKICIFQPPEQKVRVHFHSYDGVNNLPTIEESTFDCPLKAGAYFRKSKHTEAFVYAHGTYNLLSKWIKNIASPEGLDSQIGTKENKAEGIKETEGKLDYSEINLKILDLMAERFNANKYKYPKGNMKKPLNKNSLVWAAFRHIRKMLQPIKGDAETYKEHLAAVLCNMSMILDQEAFEND